MKHFYIIRHAKSSWANIEMKDIDRPLNKRGFHDAPKMAEFLMNTDALPLELIYSSPATRAYTTAKYFHQTFALKEEIDIRLEIYHADIEDLTHIITNTEDRFNHVAFFGHNPTFTSFVNKFSAEQIENLPTCGIAKFKSTADSWLDVNSSNTQRVNLWVPKKTIY